MSRLERGDDAFEPRQALKCRKRTGIANPRVLRAPEVAKPRVLRTDRGVIESGGNGMRELDVSVEILQHIGARALEHARHAAGKPGRMTSRRERFAAGFHANQAHARTRNERVENPQRIAAAAHAGHDGVGQTSGHV